MLCFVFVFCSFAVESVHSALKLNTPTTLYADGGSDAFSILIFHTHNNSHQHVVRWVMGGATDIFLTVWSI